MKHSFNYKNHLNSLKLAGIILVALGFRIFLFRYRYAIGFDEPHYLQLAISALSHNLKDILHAHWAPMYPCFIALMSLFVKNIELAGRLVSAISGSLVILPIFFLTQKLFNRKIAYYTAILIALYPPLVFASGDVLTEPAYTLLSMAGIAIGWSALEKRSNLLGLIAGVLFGMSYLSKPDGIGCLIVFLVSGIALIFFNMLTKKREKLVLPLLLSVIGFLSISSPYLIYLRKHSGKWTLSQKWDTGRYNIGSMRTLSDDNKTLPVDMGWHTGNFHELKLERKKVDSFSGVVLLKRMAKNYNDLVKKAIPGILPGALLILLILGLFGEYLEKDKTQLTIYILGYIIFFWFILLTFFQPMQRYMMPILPLCFIWIGNGLNVFRKWLISCIQSVFSDSQMLLQRARKISVTAIILSLVLFSYLPELGKIFANDQYATELWVEAIEHKKAGLWLKEHSTTTPPVLMAHNHSIDFYAGNYNIKESINIPQNNLDRVLAYARYRGAKYLVLNERYCAERYPLLSFLLSGKNVPPDLKLIYKDIDPKSGLKLLIYEIL